MANITNLLYMPTEKVVAYVDALIVENIGVIGVRLVMAPDGRIALNGRFKDPSLIKPDLWAHSIKAAYIKFYMYSNLF